MSATEWDGYDDDDDWDDPDDPDDEDICIDCQRLGSMMDECCVCGASMCSACFEMGAGVCKGQHRA